MRGGLLALVIAFGVIQLFPAERTNPAVTGDFDGPAPVREVLRRACYDCHSHETRWPWYARVAPVSWLVVHDVREGRAHMNLSTWTELAESEREELREEIWEEVREGGMPLQPYLMLHPEARLSVSDLRVLRDWAREGKAPLLGAGGQS